MDNVYDILITYKLIRSPKRATSNVLAYTANFSILINENQFLNIEDFAILDFAISLFKWRIDVNKNFIFNPMDNDSVILIFKTADEGYLIESPWAIKNNFYVKRNILLRAVDFFINSFDEDLKKNGDCLKNRIKNYKQE